MAQPNTEIHLRECKPGACVVGCSYYVAPKEEPSAPQPDLIDSVGDAAKLLWDVASAPPAEPDTADKAGGNFTRILRLLGVGK